jgi:hypothetical protein
VCGYVCGSSRKDTSNVNCCVRRVQWFAVSRLIVVSSCEQFNLRGYHASFSHSLCEHELRCGHVRGVWCVHVLLVSATRIPLRRGSNGTANLIATLKIKKFQCGNQIQPADAGVGHAGLHEVEFLQSATALQAAHVS